MTVSEKESWVLFNFANFSTDLIKKYKMGKNFSPQKILQAYDLKTLWRQFHTSFNIIHFYVPTEWN